MPMTAQAIRDFIVRQFYVPDAAALTDEQSLLESGIVDSTGVFDLIAFLETNFHIKVQDAEMVPENLDSIAHMAAYVARKQPAGA